MTYSLNYEIFSSVLYDFKIFVDSMYLVVIGFYFNNWVVGKYTLYDF